MKLHVFNPEHDIALAANQNRFTAPHAGRQMRSDLGFLPALWADNGDIVLVDDVEAAVESVRHIKKFAKDVVFVTADDLRGVSAMLPDDFEINPWGWDRTLKEQLLRADGALADFVPTDDELSIIRGMSSRQFAAERVLPLLNSGRGVVGESRYCSSIDEAEAAIAEYGHSVVKSLWSSSGRGVRYVRMASADSHILGWMRNVVRQQGGLTVEPLYQKVLDFGMEFMACCDGEIKKCGISLFATRCGAYTGSMCATETDKRGMLSRYVDLDLLDNICKQISLIMGKEMAGVYSGPFGVDMMAVANECGDGFLLHPCVEINLRRTMGHVALALTPTEFEPRRIMNVYYADKYRIRIQNTTENLLNTGLC